MQRSSACWHSATSYDLLLLGSRQVHFVGALSIYMIYGIGLAAGQPVVMPNEKKYI